MLRALYEPALISYKRVERVVRAALQRKSRPLIRVEQHSSETTSVSSLCPVLVPLLLRLERSYYAQPTVFTLSLRSSRLPYDYKWWNSDREDRQEILNMFKISCRSEKMQASSQSSQRCCYDASNFQRPLHAFAALCQSDGSGSRLW